MRQKAAGRLRRVPIGEYTSPPRFCQGRSAACARNSRHGGGCGHIPCSNRPKLSPVCCKTGFSLFRRVLRTGGALFFCHSQDRLCCFIYMFPFAPRAAATALFIQARWGAALMRLPPQPCATTWIPCSWSLPTGAISLAAARCSLSFLAGGRPACFRRASSA